ncbi:CaiB/BaiF CoA transferase family protein [Brevibacillus ginsengisoli]|uniref:CaiB/BaiF CoA transferase family protein n=1 Tax=Brevibacillus ginsengisoli TaxID=363854 RepID=UPI003CF8A372
MAKALEGITVLDLSRVLAGPFCTMILGDLGAEVIKVEHPLAEDETRSWGPPYTGGESAYFLCANRNKRAITVDLKSKSGQSIIKDLLPGSDVVVQNFKAGTLDKMGLGYEVLKSINPRIILASISGFGQTGPYSDHPGYDFIIQAMSGLMSITGSPSSGPLKVGVAIADVLTGLYTTIGILAAIQERNHSGLGQHVDISLFDSQLSALVNVASNYLVTGKIPSALGNQHPNIVPYQVFPTQDQSIVIAVGNDSQFGNLAHLLELPLLAEDDRFRTNPKRVEHREELVQIISSRLQTKPAKEWLPLLQQATIPCGPINNLQQALTDPTVTARDMLVTLPHPTADTVTLVGSPLKLSRTPVEMKRHPPLHGEHTEEILLQLGYRHQQIKELKENQTI